eukprot:jgi/Tetstr1/421294/TSEL_012269.t2
MKGSVRPIGIGSVLLRFAMRVLLRAHGEPIAQWLAARGQFGFGVKGGVELVQFLALATPTLELDAGANASAPMWAVELRAAHTRVVDDCGDAVLEDLAGPLASALKLLPSKRSHVARAGCSAAGAEPASAMRSAADLQAIPHYSDFPLHSMRKVQQTLSHRIHTVRFEKLAERMPTSGPDSTRFRGRLLRAATAFLVTDPPSMLARFEDAGVEFTPSTWAVAYVDHVARCYGGDSNHAAHDWAAHGLSDICHDVKSALGVGVQILTDPSLCQARNPAGNLGRGPFVTQVERRLRKCRVGTNWLTSLAGLTIEQLRTWDGFSDWHKYRGIGNVVADTQSIAILLNPLFISHRTDYFPDREKRFRCQMNG